jgi:hypothetical protein
MAYGVIWPPFSLGCFISRPGPSISTTFHFKQPSVCVCIYIYIYIYGLLAKHIGSTRLGLVDLPIETRFFYGPCRFLKFPFGLGHHWHYRNLFEHLVDMRQ